MYDILIHLNTKSEITIQKDDNSCYTKKRYEAWAIGSLRSFTRLVKFKNMNFSSPIGCLFHYPAIFKKFKTYVSSSEVILHKSACIPWLSG